MDAAAAEHEAIHAHAQVLKFSSALTKRLDLSHLALGLETFPDKHAGALHSGDLTGTRRNLVSA